MGQFDSLIKELETADRIITTCSEENKTLKIQLEFSQRAGQKLNGENELLRNERDYFKKCHGLETARHKETYLELEREKLLNQEYLQEIERLKKEVLHFANMAHKFDAGANHKRGIL